MRTIVVPLSLLVVLGGPGCGEGSATDGDGAEGSPGGKADDVDPADFACKTTSGATAEQIQAFRDPIAEFLIKRGDSCPTDMGEMVAKLRETDGEGCVAGEDLRTRIVSDDARLTPTPTNFRTVTTRACGSGEEKDLFWTLLGLSTTEDLRRRTGTEMIAFDPVSEQYNFYVHGSNGFSFSGSSVNVAQGASCGCHGGGGVLMKELDRPWPHFASSLGPLPGTQAFFDNANQGPDNSMFGLEGDGAELERVVRDGNDAAIGGRMRHHANPDVGTVRALLQPLFCAKQMNLDAGGEGPGEPIERLPSDFFVDPHFGGPGVPMADAIYEAEILAAGQHVDGVPGLAEKPRDKAFKFVFPERSGIDNAYVQRLVDAQIIDMDFATDVLAIDFTQPLFSDARCDLLAFVPAYGAPVQAPDDTGDTGSEDGSSGGTGSGDGSGSDTDDDPTGTGGEAVDPGDCCVAKDSAIVGCSNATIQACVCSQDAFCCNTQWDSACVSGVEEFGCFDCNGDGTVGVPVDPGGGTAPPSTAVKIAAATPDAIREAFIASLQASAPEPGSAAAQLLQHLLDREDESAHRDRAAAFLSACADRPQEAMMKDALRAAHGVRERTRGFLGVIEHSEQMPTTDLPFGLVTLHPVTCSLEGPIPDPE